MDPAYWWASGFSMFWIFPLLCLIFMVAMMVMMFRRGGCMPMRRGPSDWRNGTRETPRQILDRRLASGELTREQYEVMRRDLAAPGAVR
jgi:putative membrane protein